MSDEELKKLIESNARAIEALTANVSELARDKEKEETSISPDLFTECF
ncbi:MAG: hypothetical protein ACRDEA_12685 [Microcystaceae cyanobacterium]